MATNRFFRAQVLKERRSGNICTIYPPTDNSFFALCEEQNDPSQEKCNLPKKHYDQKKLARHVFCGLGVFYFSSRCFCASNAFVGSPALISSMNSQTLSISLSLPRRNPLCCIYAGATTKSPLAWKSHSPF